MATTQPDIILLIYRDRQPPVRMSGFASAEHAARYGKEWTDRIFFAVEVDGVRVCEETRRRAK